MGKSEPTDWFVMSAAELESKLMLAAAVYDIEKIVGDARVLCEPLHKHSPENHRFAVLTAIHMKNAAARLDLDIPSSLIAGLHLSNPLIHVIEAQSAIVTHPADTDLTTNPSVVLLECETTVSINSTAGQIIQLYYGQLFGHDNTGDVILEQPNLSDLHPLSRQLLKRQVIMLEMIRCYLLYKTVTTDMYSGLIRDFLTVAFSQFESEIDLLYEDRDSVVVFQ